MTIFRESFSSLIPNIDEYNLKDIAERDEDTFELFLIKNGTSNDYITVWIQRDGEIIFVFKPDQYSTTIPDGFYDKLDVRVDEYVTKTEQRLKTYEYESNLVSVGDGRIVVNCLIIYEYEDGSFYEDHVGFLYDLVKEQFE